MERISELSFQILSTHKDHIVHLYHEYGYPITLQELIRKINHFIQETIKNILSETPYIILLKNSTSNAKFNLQKYCFEKTQNYDEDSESDSEKTSYFSKLTIKTSSLKISRILRFFDILLPILKKEEYANKRELFYKDVGLFETQTNIDLIIKEICFHFEIPRKALHIISASKGLIAGSISFYEGNMFFNLENMEYMNKGKILTEFPEFLHSIQTNAQFVLILEKETIFYKFLMQNYWMTLGNCILVTGKGYPDLATKNFLKRLALEFPQLPFFYLGDYDPYGFDILCNYAFSNEFQAYELNNLPHIHWLRIDIDEILDILNTKELANSSLILDVSQIDLDKIREIKEKRLYKEIVEKNFQNNSNIMLYQTQRWELWFKTLDEFEKRKKKFELDCVEELTKKTLIECVFYKIKEEKWL